MALRGNATGGYSFLLPGGFDDTADLSAFLWVRRSNNAAKGARIFNLINPGRSRGFTIHLGGTVNGTNSASDVVVSVGSTRDTIWGADDQDGRGRAILPGASATEFCALAFSVRGSAAADNTAAAGAQQLHQVWWQGLPAAVTSTAIGSGIPVQGGRSYLLCRDQGNLSAFNGWVAEVAVWQGHRLSEAEALRLSRGGSPLWVAPDKLLFYRSFRSGLAAEAGDMTLDAIGAGGSLETQTHPPLLVEGSGALHAGAGTTPDLLAEDAADMLIFPHGAAMAQAARTAALTVTGAPPLAPVRGLHGHAAGTAALTAAVTGALGIGRARHAVRTGSVALTATGRLQPHGGLLALMDSTPGLLPVAGAAEVLLVPQEARLMIAGIF